jgi:tetratricopeptide (TPR) repeat protein
MRGLCIAALFAICALPIDALAFERCDELFPNPEALRKFVAARAVESAPVKYLEKARSILVTTTDPQRLMPVATFDKDRNPVIVYPSTFPPFLCRIVIGNYLDIESDNQSQNSSQLQSSAHGAAECIASKRSHEECLTQFGLDLEKQYRDAFHALDDQKRATVHALVMTALRQIVQHEYAHHLLNHVQRIGSGTLARIDAEFEADYYAIMQSIQLGELPFSMGYFFRPLSEMENFLTTASTYESSACRLTNAYLFQDALGFLPLHLVGAIKDDQRVGTIRERGVPSVLRSETEELQKRGAPALNDRSCGRLSPVILRESYFELSSIAVLIAEYADLLASTIDSEEELERRSGHPKFLLLISRLLDVYLEVNHLKGLAASLLSVLAARAERFGKQDASLLVNRTLQVSSDDMLGSDYGRLLGLQANNILHNRDQSLDARIRLAEPMFEKSIKLLPNGVDAWMNLAFVAFVRGDCLKAAEMADQAARFANSPKEAEDFRDELRSLAATQRCTELAGKMAADLDRPLPNAEGR